MKCQCSKSLLNLFQIDSTPPPQKKCSFDLRSSNFQSTKSPIELNSLLMNFSCYVTWFDERWNWRPCKRGLYLEFYCFFDTIAQFKNYKLQVTFAQRYLQSHMWSIFTCIFWREQQFHLHRMVMSPSNI